MTKPINSDADIYPLALILPEAVIWLLQSSLVLINPFTWILSPSSTPKVILSLLKVEVPPSIVIPSPKKKPLADTSPEAVTGPNNSISLSVCPFLPI